MNKITPFLWFDDKAEEAARFYVSIFGNGRIAHVMRHGDNAPQPKGSVLSVEFEIEGQTFTALNGGPHYRLTPAISFFVNCETQAEIDRLWQALAEGGEPMRCGWVTDRFGVTWQIVPQRLLSLLEDADPARSARVWQALMGMIKLDIAALEAAHAGR